MNILNEENYLEKTLNFRDRQAGVSVIFDPNSDKFFYNAYCLDKKLLKDIYTMEFNFLSDALAHINEEFGNWDLEALINETSGCGNCAAK